LDSHISNDQHFLDTLTSKPSHVSMLWSRYAVIKLTILQILIS